MSGRRIRVLVVDDSAVVRMFLSKSLERDEEIEVVGTAVDPYSARQKLLRLRPDVMTLDLHMPRMNGIDFLERVMRHAPLPTIVISSLAKRGSEVALKALEMGAFAVLEKPVLSGKSVEAAVAGIVEHVKAAARSRFRSVRAESRSSPQKVGESQVRILAIASSTGGTEALKSLVVDLPADLPPTVIVQHMPAHFTEAFAGRLNDLAPFEVREAKAGDQLRKGLALLAPGDRHMRIEPGPKGFEIRLSQEAPVHGVRPAADLLMESVANHLGRWSIGLVLTGMGRDGAAGSKQIKDAGGYVIAQDEESSVVFGMPKCAIEAGAVDDVVSLDKIGGAIVRRLKTGFTAGRQ